MDEHEGAAREWMVRYSTKILPTMEEAVNCLITHFIDVPE